MSKFKKCTRFEDGATMWIDMDKVAIIVDKKSEGADLLFLSPVSDRIHFVRESVKEKAVSFLDN